MEPDSYQWCSGEESMSTNWNTGCSLCKQTHFFFTVEKNFSSYESRFLLLHGTSEQGVQRGCGLHTGTYPKTVWKWFRSVSYGPALSERVWLNYHQKFPSSSSNLWFCDLLFLLLTIVGGNLGPLVFIQFCSQLSKAHKSAHTDLQTP